MSGAAWLALFLLLALGALAGLFLYGWKRRKEKPPKVAPIPYEDED